jgi:hypothetical protein
MEVLLDMVSTQSLADFLAGTDCSMSQGFYPSTVYARSAFIVVEMTGCLHHTPKCVYPREKVDLASNHWKRWPARAVKLAHVGSSDRPGAAAEPGLEHCRPRCGAWKSRLSCVACVACVGA